MAECNLAKAKRKRKRKRERERERERERNSLIFTAQAGEQCAKAQSTTMYIVKDEWFVRRSRPVE
jgi:hypothetical protein